jgi:hypothetical protein
MQGIVPREAEMHELFLYSFILLRNWTLSRRIGACSSASRQAA